MATWYCKNGNLPYQTTWPTCSALSDTGKYLTDKQYYESRQWKCRNGELPYKSCWPDAHSYCDVVRQSPYICVYDMCTAQNDFDNNGLAILTPTKCEIAEELNGAYELTLTHPIDDYGKWQRLLELNIIKANGQLFRIYKKSTTLTERTVYARHIFYDLNDKLLEDVRPEDKNGQQFIDWIMTHMFVDDPADTYTFYDYSYSSDIADTATAYYQGVSPVAALMGEDNCFINRLGGELHRDNFYFSVNARLENALDDAFYIRYGADMLEVEEEIDYSDWCSYLKCTDNFGNVWATSYIGLPQIHHNVTKSLTFNYEVSDFNQLARDGQAYFSDHYLPKISYKVTFANLKKDPRYKGFIDLQHCNVGDKGTVFCDKLKIYTEQKVVKKTTDVLTDTTVSVELGNLKSNLTRKDKYDDMIGKDPANVALQKQLHNTRLKLAQSWGDAEKNFTWEEAEEFTWEEIEND